MATIFCVVVSDGDTETIWSSSPSTLADAIRAAETCARCNPHKTWSAVTYEPTTRHAVAAAGDARTLP